MTWTPLIRICATLDQEQTKKLTLQKYTCQVNEPSITRSTPLHFVALGKNTELAKWLLDNGAAFTTNEYGHTPVHWACKTGYLPMLELFLEHIPLDLITQKDEEGATAMDWALEYEQTAVVKRLSEYFPDVPAPRRSRLRKLSGMLLMNKTKEL